MLLSLLVLAGCGSGGDETALLGPGEASRLDERVERVGARVAEGDCEGAREALSQYAGQVDALPDRRDAELRQALRDGATELERTITADCEPQEEPETTESTLETETETEPTTTTETEPTTTTEPEPTTTTQPEPTTTTQPDPVPDDGGGDGNEGGGNGNGGGGDGNEGGGNGNQGGGNGAAGGIMAPEDGG